jgi:hypothetical protein
MEDALESAIEDEYIELVLQENDTQSYRAIVYDEFDN